ncbi:hypothetical protein D7I39_03685 [Allopusillimonas ginsengisoli]|nr:hypothetical protein D7I39_03685 [Allopusillimonas ginsengisoli]
MRRCWPHYTLYPTRRGPRFQNLMNQLVRRPLLLSFLLSLPLWIIFNNYIVALIVGLLAGFLVSMCHSLWVINQKKNEQKRK